MKLKIKVTKDILEKSKMCGVENSMEIPTNCAISLAIRDIFPLAYVQSYYMYFDINDVGNAIGMHENSVSLPIWVTDYIQMFDMTLPDDRPKLPEFEFEISVPDSIIERININEIKTLLQNHPTLELIPSNA